MSIQRELMELKEELRKEVHSRSDSSHSTMLSILGGFIALITIVGGILGFVGWSKVKQAEREYDKAEKELQEIKNKYRKEADSISTVCLEINKNRDFINDLVTDLNPLATSISDQLSDDMTNLLAKKLDFNDSLDPDEVEKIDFIISETKVPIITRLQAMGLKAMRGNQWESAFLIWNILEGVCFSQPVIEFIFIRSSACLIKLNRLGKAIKKCKEALDCNPENATAWNNLGVIYYLLNDLDKSIDYFTNAVDYDDLYHTAWFNLGRMLGAKGDWHNAIDKYRKALDCGANYSYVHSSLGSALSRIGDFDEAFKEFRRASVLPNANYDVYMSWRNALLKAASDTSNLERKHKLKEEAEEKFRKAQKFGYRSDSSKTDEEDS